LFAFITVVVILSLFFILHMFIVFLNNKINSPKYVE
jgi:hypothetical protein